MDLEMMTIDEEAELDAHTALIGARNAAIADWRLFDFGKVDAEVASARSSDAEVLASYQQSVLRAAEDVENAFVGLTQTEARNLRIPA
jgi:outer membrane protein TolC